MAAKITPAEYLSDELTPYQAQQAEYYQSPEGLAKLDAKQKKDAQINALTQQILGSSDSSKWSGEGYGGAKANAKAMAKLLADAGIADIRQFGKVDKYEPVQVAGYTLNGKTVQNPSPGVYYESVLDYDGENGATFSRRNLTPEEVAQVKPVYQIATPTSFDSDGNSIYTPIDASKVVEKDGQLVGVTGQTFGNKETGEAINTGSGRWLNQGGDNLFSGTGEGEGNTGFRVNIQPDGTPVFYTTQGTSNDLAQLMQDLGPLGNIALAVATGGLSIPQQIAANMAVQVLSGKDLGDAIKNAAISMAVSNIPGSDVMKEANKYIKGLDLPAAVTSTLNNAVQNAVTSGAKAVLTGQDIGAAMLKGAAAGGTNGAVTAMLKEVDGFGNLTGAQKKMVINAVTGVVSGKPLDQLVINAAIAAANAEIADQKKNNTPISEKEYGLLDDVEKKIYDEGGSKALNKHFDEVKAINKTLAGINTGATANTDSGLSNQDILDMVGAGSLTGAAGNDTVTGVTDDELAAILKTSDLTDSGLSNQDILDIVNADTITGASGNDSLPGAGGNDDTVSITGAAGNDTLDTLDSGLSNQDILDMIYAGSITGAGGNDDTVSITGGAGNDTLGETDTITGAGGNDIVGATRGLTDLGTTTITGAKGNDAVKTDEHGCLETEYWDPILESCQLKVLDTVTGGGGNDTITGGGGNDKLTCPTGYTLNAAGTECIKEVEIVDKKCDPGYVFDEDLMQCVPATTETDTLVGGGGNDTLVGGGGNDKLTCPTGYKLNDAGTECIKEIEIVDKKCDPGFVYDEDLKMCVAEKAAVVCDPGFHEENGVCVPDQPTAIVCDPGFHEENGVCVPDKKPLTCPPGKVLNAEGTACIDEVEIVDKKCDPGYVYDEDLKQCVPVDKPPIQCDPGYHEENGACVKDKLVCDPGFHEENGVCVPDKEEPKKLTCPPGKVLNADGTACIDEVIIKDKKCDPGYVYDEDLMQCVPETKALVCDAGYHEENGVCVPDKVEPPPLQCAEGYEPDATGTKCIPVVVIKDKKCDPGFVYDEDLQQCVPVEKPPIQCEPGYHLENGVCVKDKLVCETGFHEENGVCVKDAVITPPIVPPIVPPKPTTQLPALAAAPTIGAYSDTSRTDPVYAGAMDDFDLFATLQDILASDSNKNSTQQGQQTTKMATGGHLDDLLAEQMTVDDLLKLLR